MSIDLAGKVAIVTGAGRGLGFAYASELAARGASVVVAPASKGIPMTVANGLAEIRALAGHDLGHSSWVEVPQSRIDAFADATGDRQWIHTEPERAKDGPFGGTIAHGYLTLALLVPMWSEILEIKGIGMAINYGVNRVRFPAPVPSGSRIRLTATLGTVTDVPGGVQALVDFTMLSDGTAKPVLVAECLYRYYE